VSWDGNAGFMGPAALASGLLLVETMKAHKHNTTSSARRRHHHHEEMDGGDAFLLDPRHGFTPAREGDVEAFGEEFIAGATSNEAIGELARDETYAEEIGGFVFELYDEETFDRPESI
jgi:hypothetical protein